MSKKVAIIGYGYVGQSYHNLFPDAIIYDEPKKILLNHSSKWKSLTSARAAVNTCDVSIVCVPTELNKNGELDMSIVEDVTSWLETPVILIKSALMPGTVDKLVRKTGKRIAVSVELVGMGNYYVDPSEFPDPKNPAKHKTLIIGGDLETATLCDNSNECE